MPRGRNKTKKDDDGKHTSITTLLDQDEETVGTSATSEDLESINVTASEEEDEDEKNRREELSRATSRLLSKRSLLQKLSENDEIMQQVLSHGELDVESGFVKVDKDDEKSTEKKSSSNVSVETNEIIQSRESIVTEVEATEESSLLDSPDKE